MDLECMLAITCIYPRNSMYIYYIHRLAEYGYINMLYMLNIDQNPELT